MLALTIARFTIQEAITRRLILAGVLLSLAFLALFGLAWLGGMIEFIGAALQNEAMLNLGTAVSLVIPSDAVWRGASYFVQPPVLLSMAMAGPGGLPFFSLTPPAMPMLVWALGYPLVFLIGAILTFRRRDL